MKKLGIDPEIQNWDCPKKRELTTCWSFKASYFPLAKSPPKLLPPLSAPPWDHRGMILLCGFVRKNGDEIMGEHDDF